MPLRSAKQWWGVTLDGYNLGFQSKPHCVRPVWPAAL
jgi:hypothetical protein